MRVEFGGVLIADSTQAIRVLETSHPPGIYIPPGDIALDSLRSNPQSTYCEWKGQAVYWDVVVAGETSVAAGWSYPEPTSPFSAIADYVSFYPGRVDACFLGDERVIAQEGNFYGGWVTSDIVGPFKGGAGTRGW